MLTYSVGELVDKLTIIHLKVWHLEEKIAELKDKGAESEIEKLCDQVVNLNTMRNKIIESINEHMGNKDG